MTEKHEGRPTRSQVWQAVLREPAYLRLSALAAYTTAYVGGVLLIGALSGDRVKDSVDLRDWAVRTLAIGTLYVPLAVLGFLLVRPPSQPSSYVAPLAATLGAVLVCCGLAVWSGSLHGIVLSYLIGISAMLALRAALAP